MLGLVGVVPAKILYLSVKDLKVINSKQKIKFQIVKEHIGRVLARWPLFRFDVVILAPHNNKANLL
jgi:hypothetical protein